MRVTRELTALRARWVELYAVPCPPDMTPALLKLAVAWKEQVDEHGDISPALLRDLHVIARSERDRKRGGAPVAAVDQPAELPASTRLVPGARLVKVYQGVTHVVDVGEDSSFTWNGTGYASLSAVAKAITGTHWNGLLFFGLRTRRVKPRHDRGAPPVAPASNVRGARTKRGSHARRA